MRFTIHDVGHGFCAHLMHDNGNAMLWDCGHKSDPDNRPSEFLPAAGVSTVHCFVVTNYDEDHISDLPNLRRAVTINTLYMNRSIAPPQLKQLKEETGPLSPAMSALLSMLDEFTADVTNPPSFPDIRFEMFYCNYPADFQDTNNLSLVTFLETPMYNFVIPGDVENPAWEKLLQKPEFRTHLERTNIFIASHHGRTSGYCSEVFQYCRPSVVIFSDGPKQYATQEETNTYAQHASGIMVNGRERYVLTTRNDGTIWWSS